MSSPFEQPPEDRDWYLAPPFKLAAVGLGLGFASYVLSHIDWTTLPQVVALVAGILVAGGGVWWRMGSKPPDTFEERSKTAILVCIASLSIVGGWAGMPEEWDSLRLLLAVFWWVAFASVPILLLPRLGRRIVVSLLVLFHFGGILTATTAVGLANGSSPWVPTAVWTHLYRKYLTFTYLNNAYHFYSPEPGPPSLVWFLVEFDEGDPHWIRLVRRDEVPTRQQYQRYLSLTESINTYQNIPYPKLQALMGRRYAASTKFLDRNQQPQNIPLHPFLDPSAQFREPTDLAKLYLKSYAQYVCRTAKSKTHPDARVKTVKIYRLTHLLIRADQIDQGMSPTDPTLFSAYFFGEYGPDGELVPCADKDLEWKEMNANGTWVDRREKARDPFLYWMLPIYIVPKPGYPNPTKRSHYDLIDTLSLHAGVTIEWELD